jgi:CMP-N-acetylneuraminic acid synthetase
MNITAVIVSRKGSKRIPNKAWEGLDNLPLIERKIIQLSKVSSVQTIVVGSNDTNIKPLAEKYNIQFIQREEKFCDEKSSTPNDMIRNMLSYFESDGVLWAHLTNPFITEYHYTEAIKLFNENKNEYDSVFSAVELKDHFWQDKTTPLNHNPFSSKHVVARDLKPVYKQNGGIFIRHKKDMIVDGRFIGNRPLMYVMNEVEGWDLDYPWQLETAKALISAGLVK